MHLIGLCECNFDDSSARGRRTSDLLLERGDEEDSLLQNAELGLWLVRLQSHSHHLTELFKRHVDVTNSHSTSEIQSTF